MKKLYILFALAIILHSINTSAQNVNIPDVNFKAALVSNSDINTNTDEEIQESEANSYNGTINLIYEGIFDLTGIEAFTSIIGLNCYGNNLTSLDLSNNTSLVIIECNNNQLSSLDISNNIVLENLKCEENQLTSLDLNDNTTLKFLNFTYNQISNINLSNNLSLIDIRCGYNNLSTIDLSENNNLAFLVCNNNQLTTIDLSNNPFLFQFVCSSNPITSFDLSNNTSFLNFYCDNTDLSTLDLSNNTNLKKLSCKNNESLSSLNLKNGNNINMELFEASNNTNLFCIEVDNPTWSAANWANIDDQSSFSENCSSSISEKGASTFNIYPNPSTGLINIQTESLDRIEIYNLRGVLIESTKLNDIDLSEQTKGIYFVKVVTTKGTETKKILLE